MSENAIRTYRAFWPYYLRQHARPLTRHWHIAGTVAAILLLTGAVLLERPWLLAASLAVGYGPAWCAHFLVEKNAPATLRYPLWSLVSDLRMAVLWLSGSLSKELDKAGLPPKDAV